MRLVSVERGGIRFAGVLHADHIVPIRNSRWLEGDLLVDPSSAVLDERSAVAIEDVRLLTPIPAPGKIICVGLNYAPHIAETNRERPTYPVLFTKFASALIGPSDPIVKPAETDQLDWEAELTIVVGRPGRRVRREDALAHVAGYTVANDITARDYQYRSHQWLQGKTWDQTTPVGPSLVTADELGDAAGLELTLTVNGDVMQSGNTSELIFDVATLIATVSEFTALVPGDLILTGTPGGVGYRRDPQVFLTPGDLVRVEIEGIGRLENRVMAETVR
jgi:acylpyruvate hydrolase